MCLCPAGTALLGLEVIGSERLSVLAGFSSLSDYWACAQQVVALIRTVPAGCPDGVAHLEVLLCPRGCGAQQMDHAAGPPGGISY